MWPINNILDLFNTVCVFTLPTISADTFLAYLIIINDREKEERREGAREEEKSQCSRCNFM